MAKRPMKRCSTLLLEKCKSPRKCKNTMIYDLKPVRMVIIKTLQTIDAGEGVEKRELSYTVCGNVSTTTVENSMEVP